MNEKNKKYLKDNYNIDVDKYSEEQLNEILDIIEKNLLKIYKNEININKELKNKLNELNSEIKE